MALEETLKSPNIVIYGEKYFLLSRPPETSALVCEEKKKLLGSLDLEQLVKYLGHVGSFIRIAYNGVGAAGPKFQNLQIEIQRLGYDITKLCDKSAVTVASFESTSKTVLYELQATYEYLLDGFEDQAILSFSSMADLASKMAAAAHDLQLEFENQEKRVIITLETTQSKKASEEIEKEELKKEREKMEQQKQTEQKLLEEHSRLEQEARKERLYYEHKEDKAVEKGSGLLGGVLGVLSSAFTGFPLIGSALKDLNNSSAAHAEKWKQKSLQKLEIEKYYRNLRHEGLKKMSEFAFQIEHLQDEDKIADAAVKALHEASGALKQLSVIMMQAVLFWEQVRDHCESLSKPDFKRELKNALDNYGEDKKTEFFTSAGFVRKAVTYYARWVALYSVCHEYHIQIKYTRDDLYKYIEENPTWEESRVKLKDLTKEFVEVLKKAQEEIAQRDLEADEEMKKLQN